MWEQDAPRNELYLSSGLQHLHSVACIITPLKIKKALKISLPLCNAMKTLYMSKV